MKIFFGDFESETLKQLINDIVDYACDNEFSIPNIKQGFVVYDNGKEKTLCQKAIDKINLKIEKAVGSAEKEHNESRAGRIAVNSDYFSNLI
jgi:hypothetical protein